MIVLTSLAALVTAAAIVALALTDPKRARVAGRYGMPTQLGKRRALAAAALVPGVALAMMGEGGCVSGVAGRGGAGGLGDRRARRDPHRLAYPLPMTARLPSARNA